MNRPGIVSRAEWLGPRKALLAKEKEFTRQRDAVNAERRRLPMMRIDKDDVFEGPHGPVRLLDLFEGRQQLIVYHFMFDLTDEAWGIRRFFVRDPNGIVLNIMCHRGG